MTKKLIKLSIAIVVIAGVVGSSFSTKAYPAFLRKAQKFGAKNCLYCHKQPTGGEGWNPRGEWLIAEKERRKADEVDPEWLVDYKEGAKKDAENKEGVKKDAENKEGVKKDAENKEGAKKDAENKEGVEKDAENKEGAKIDAEKKEGAKKDAENKEEKKEESKKKEKPNQ
jgi:hypothetical protein